MTTPISGLPTRLTARRSPTPGTTTSGAQSPEKAYVYAPRKLPKGRRLYDLLINPYLRSPFTREQGLYVYSPLVDTPKLFLEFASLPENPGFDEEPNTEHNTTVVLDWIHAYGVLDVTSSTSSDS